MLVYADHGNLILHENCKIEDVKRSKLIYDEEWVRIPYAVCSPDMGRGRSHRLTSLMSLNDVLLSLLSKKAYNIPDNRYVKIARSELYNPDFRHLYKKMGQERCLSAFEGYIFADGYKLIIYSDGFMEILLAETDDIIQDEKLATPAPFNKNKTVLSIGDSQLIGVMVDIGAKNSPNLQKPNYKDLEKGKVAADVALSVNKAGIVQIKDNNNGTYSVYRIKKGAVKITATTSDGKKTTLTVN